MEPRQRLAFPRHVAYPHPTIPQHESLQIRPERIFRMPYQLAADCFGFLFLILKAVLWKYRAQSLADRPLL
jgi:hypothetical protein